MTGEEWAEVATELEYAFKGELDEMKERVYRRHLDKRGHAAVMLALTALVERGQVFLPSVGEIVQAIEYSSRPPEPTFDEAWAVVRPALANSTTAVKTLTEGGAAEVVVAWVASYGGQRLGLEPTEDPTHGGAVMHGLQQSYEQFLERAHHRRVLGLPILDEAVRAKVGDLHTPGFDEALGSRGAGELTAGEEG